MVNVLLNTLKKDFDLYTQNEECEIRFYIVGSVHRKHLERFKSAKVCKALYISTYMQTRYKQDTLLSEHHAS